MDTTIPSSACRNTDRTAEIEITYRKSGGRKKTVGYGTKNFLDPKDLKRVFDALINN